MNIFLKRSFLAILLVVSATGIIGSFLWLPEMGTIGALMPYGGIVVFALVAVIYVIRFRIEKRLDAMAQKIIEVCTLQMDFKSGDMHIQQFLANNTKALGYIVGTGSALLLSQKNAGLICRVEEHTCVEKMIGVFAFLYGEDQAKPMLEKAFAALDDEESVAGHQAGILEATFYAKNKLRPTSLRNYWLASNADKEQQQSESKQE